MGPQNYKCPRCGKIPYKNYCRQCDEFFYSCGCPPDPPDVPYSNNHEGLRTY